jgi:protein-histidine pros-kinase
MSATDARVWRNMIFFVGVASAIFVALLILLNVLLSRYVISPVNRMAKIAEAYSMGETSVAEFEYSGSDEVASLSRSFNRMRRSLDSAMKMLEKSGGRSESASVSERSKREPQNKDASR